MSPPKEIYVASRTNLTSLDTLYYHIRGVSNRKVDQRAPLQTLIRAWLSKALSTDPLRAVRPASFILDAKGIKKLSTVHPDRMKTVGDVTAALEETEEWTLEWGTSIIEIIANYDAEISAQSAEHPAPAKRGKVKENEATGTDTEYAPWAKRAKTAVLTEANPNVEYHPLKQSCRTPSLDIRLLLPQRRAL
ncbi:hypothetical protein B0H14DRAFT_3599693 [Mycena olivaceomarginata]|nr:hypothetical protein B0H14DRAFT_3599693 [Mycena olivaceomarginata]